MSMAEAGGADAAGAVDDPVGEGKQAQLGKVLEISRRVGGRAHIPAGVLETKSGRARRIHVGNAWGNYRRVRDMQGT